MNRKIAMSGFSMLSALVLLGGSAFAAFSSQASATENTFSTGDAELLIAPDVANSPGTYSSSITGPSYSGLKPGDSQVYTFWLKNTSEASINLALTADVSSIVSSQLLDQTLLISWVCDTALNGFGDDTVSGQFSPRAWLDGGNAGVGTLAPGAEAQCKMFGDLPSSADNSVAGQTVNFDVVYDGVQTP